MTKSVKRASYADQRPDLQIKQDDRDLCEDNNNDVDELLDPESLCRTVVSHRTLFCFTPKRYAP
jgi:hypothetical protein